MVVKSVFQMMPTCKSKAGLTLGDFFLRHRLFQGRAIFNGRTIMAPCVHIRRLDFRKSPTIFPKNSVHHNNIRSI